VTVLTKLGLIAFAAALLPSVTVGQEEGAESGSSELVPLPREVVAPKSNLTTPAKVRLGKMLFFDPRLSGNNKMSCATCHMPDKAFGDGLATSPGANDKPLKRNTQTCLNVGFFKSFFWDGRAGSLEEQALAPIQSPVEMNQGLDELEAELNAVPGYVVEFENVFGSKPNRDGIAKALAAFQRTLVTGLSPFDRFLAGEKDALSRDAKAGFELFQGEAGCIECHNGPLLSDGKFYRLGVAYNDEGRAGITGRKEDRFRFRTPSLRNVAETGPYMHDGSMKTLDDVITFYFRGVPDARPDGLAPDTSALRGQSFSEIPLLVTFLKSLSGAVPKITPPELP
jgi:cytochrome c peroxidase